MTTRRLTILFVPLDGHGHINFCHGIAEALHNRNHRVIFVLSKPFKGRLVQYGFEEEIIEKQNEQNNEEESTEEFWPEFVKKNSFAFKSTALFAAEKFIANAFTQMHSRNKELDRVYENIIGKIKPDIIMVDMYCGSPTLTNCGIPWVWVFSAAPHLMLNSDKIPPHWSVKPDVIIIDMYCGCPTLTNSGIPWVWLYSAAPHDLFNSDKIPAAYSGLPMNNQNGWKEFNQKRYEIMIPVKENIDNYYLSKNLPKLPANRLHPESPYLNIYVYPKELDYDQLVCLPKTYFRIDASVRTTTELFSIPESLVSKRGKLIFLTMGSFGSGDIELMIRLTNILSKSPNRFIVSKGAGHAKYELPDNMWGQRMVPQTKVLPLVDLVIHHGGNNTLTETFYFGKPMIVMPLFGDQLDNGQRVAELGYGIRLSPYYCTEKQLLNSIDDILSNDNLKEKMKSIGKRIRNSDHKEKVADRIESIAKLI